MAADRLYWLHALSPLHVGTGRGEGYIDLPLAREKVTNFPYVPGSSVKGVFADACGATDDARKSSDLLRAAFGRAGDDVSNAGALVFTDARLVCLPVRSVYGTFAWCTSRFVLARLARDYAAAGATAPALPHEIRSQTAIPVQVPDAASALGAGGHVFLEDLDGTLAPTAEAEAWAVELSRRVFPDDAWRPEFVKRFAVLPDDVFNFLCETGTEVQPHVRIEAELKRVADGALWYEESLPAETILGGLVWCDRVYGVQNVTREQVLGLCADRDAASALQIGGKASVGKGRTRLRFNGGATP